MPEMSGPLFERFQHFALKELLTEALAEMTRVKEAVKPESIRRGFAAKLADIADQAKGLGVDVERPE
jgi:hypothetical protein